MRSAEPAIIEGLIRTRFPFCSRYTLNPRLCASPPVFHDNITRFAPLLSTPECAEKDCSVMLVGAVIVSTHVDVLLVRFGSVWSAVTFAVFETTPDAPGSVKMEIVAVPALAMEPSRQVTVPPASEQVPCVVFEERYVTIEGSVSVTVTFVAVAGPLFFTARM